MDLAAIVNKYREVAGKFGVPVPLAQLGLPAGEIESTFSAWDEDYQISRFMELSHRADSGAAFTINGIQATHVAFHEGVQRVAGLTPQ